MCIRDRATTMDWSLKIWFNCCLITIIVIVFFYFALKGHRATRTAMSGKPPEFDPLQKKTVVNLLLLAAMLGTMVSAIILSRAVFAFLPISCGIALARPMHIFCSFWSFVLMALHLGLHWKMVLGMVRWVTGPVSSPVLRGTLRIGGAAVAVYGLYALVKNQMVSYLLLQSSFVFFDFERPLPLFFTEYLAIMGLFVFLAHYGARGVQRLTKKG